MRRKAVSVLLSMSMLASMSGCGQTQETSNTQETSQMTSEVQEQTTAPAEDASSEQASGEAYKLDSITVVVDGTFNASLDAGQADFIEQWEKEVGIDLIINQLDHSSYTDGVGRLFASGDYPDVILLNAGLYAEYAKTGMLWDMTEAYDNADFQSRMILPEVNQNVRIDGKQYGIATGLGGGCITYVKKKWLDAVGMKAEDIKDWDSYYEMLKAFATQDPDGNGKDDTYGVCAAGFVGSEAPYTNYLPQFWQNAYPAFLQDENGVWYDGFDTTETKEALKRLQQAYADKVIDPESLTIQTKGVREKWWSQDQAGSFGSFTYWAGYWNDNLVDNMTKNGIDSELVRLEPIAEMDGYLNRESPVYCIIDDGDGDDSREQAIFDAFFETMFDGDKVQMLWVYGAEDVHWSTHAESFTTGEGETLKEYNYDEGEFHLKLNPADPANVWKKNAIDPSSMIVSMTNGYETATDLTKECNIFFAANCIDAPKSASAESLSNYNGTLVDMRNEVIANVVVRGMDIDECMAQYEADSANMVAEILEELNQQ
ncbi:MAG: ABC transporter substrate-binding protein [Lachnospiraceae bacterium]|nr:ABC transporter substrate-binding protein [Lachnospiraceae bacterium]